MRLLVRVAAWCVLAAIVFATLAPIGLRPVSGLPVAVERFGAFLVTGALFAAGYRERLLGVAVLVLGSAALLEVLQLLSPSRHGQWPDAGVKLAGAACGLALGWLLTQARRPVAR